MRLSQVFARLAVFLVAAVISYFGAKAVAAVVEDRSVVAVQEALIDEGLDWVSVLGDGLQVILEGEAPSEATRFRSMTIAGGVVDASRVIDNLSVVDPAGLVAPEFAIEILRNDSGVSLIGLVPATTDRESLSMRITDIAEGKPVADFLEQADYPVPATWRPALNYAVRALAILPRSKISVTAELVSITAIADSVTEKRQLESDLARQRPDGVQIRLSISAPRPVISPYITRFHIDEDGAGFDSCTADTPASRDQIVAAATAAGLDGKADCTLALGVPSATWGEAVSLAIGALADLGGGTVTISDADVGLVAKEGTSQALFDQVVGELDANLPDLFALEATLPVPAVEADGSEGPPQFTATLSPEGLLQLRGKISDALMNHTTENYAQAKFGYDAVVVGTRISENLPANWSVRVLAGLDALSKLSRGIVIVTPDNIEVRGSTGNQEASAEVSRLLVEKLGESTSFDLDITYVEQLDPVALLPTPQECIDRVNAITAEQKILFDPGSASITAATIPVIGQIADALRDCMDIPMEIAGYTDSQGREEMNLALSKNRAEAVLSALRARRIPTGSYTANGYGEADPIADNETEEGREANRRIEFRLLGEETPLEAPGEVAEDGPQSGETATAPVTDAETVGTEPEPAPAPADGEAGQ